MMAGRRGALLGAALLLLPAAAVGLAIAAAPAPGATGPSAYASGAGNLTVARTLAQDLGFPVAAVVSDLTLLDGDGLVLLPAAGAVLPRHREALDAHLARGGSAWVAGGAGLAPWLAARGASIGTQPLLQAGATDGEVLLAGGLGDERFARVASDLPGTLLLDPEAGWHVWLEAPATAHIDLDGDGRIGQADPPGPFPVGAAQRQPTGGLLILTADASLLSDAAMGRPQRDNRELWQAVLGEAAPTRLLVDESQHGWTSREAAWAGALRATAAAASVPGWLLAVAALAAAVGLAAAVAATAPVRDTPRHTPSDPALPPVARGAGDEAVAEIAWDLLARRTGRPMAELRAAGPEAARGLAEDPALRRVLLGHGSAQDRRHVLSSSLSPDGRPETRP